MDSPPNLSPNQNISLQEPDPERFCSQTDADLELMRKINKICEESKERHETKEYESLHRDKDAEAEEKLDFLNVNNSFLRGSGHTRSRLSRKHTNIDDDERKSVDTEDLELYVNPATGQEFFIKKNVVNIPREFRKN
eukprot:snap_masked-scaffold_3-processed-gene-17.4-mRNA-1 protein AED:0.98 eAED:1.00 QI:0/-1/0/1/-1/1/1/0/136